MTGGRRYVTPASPPPTTLELDGKLMDLRCEFGGTEAEGGEKHNIAEIPNSSWYDHSAPRLQKNWGEIMQIRVCSFPSLWNIRRKRKTHNHGVAYFLHTYIPV